MPDIELGGTRVKQVGLVSEQNWKQPLRTSEVSGVIVVQVKRYAVDETQPKGLGVELAEFNPCQPVQLIGTNDMLLYADNGEVALQRTTENPADWLAAIEAKAAEADPRPR